MQLVRSVSTMQRLGKTWKRKGVNVALVPTMGFLHAGHLGLIKRARELVGPRGQVVVSIFINPAQFGPEEDFSRYPRNLKRDLRLSRNEGANVVFAPGDEEIYPQNNGVPFSTFVVEENLSRHMEGASRPSHFRGVTTVVAKLFNIVQPTVAVFGAKDFQQAAIIKRMVSDLNFPLTIDVAPIHREPDGLAMSSRNYYLEGELRAHALVLWRAIEKMHAALRDSMKPLPAARLKDEVRRCVESEGCARLDYVEFFDPNTLAPVHNVAHGTQMALAVFVGDIRLIDNSRL